MLIWHRARTGVYSFQAMEIHPTAVLPPASPTLEAFALAAGEGMAEEGRTSQPTVVTFGTEGLPAWARTAPLVIVGCRTDLKDSREGARRILQEFAKSPSASRCVALFEVRMRAPPSDRSVPYDERLVEEPLDMSKFAPPERFVIDPAPGGEFAGRFELDHARRWGARIYREWQARIRSVAIETPPSEREVPLPRIVPWCGATE